MNVWWCLSIFSLEGLSNSTNQIRVVPFRSLLLSPSRSQICINSSKLIDDFQILSQAETIFPKDAGAIIARSKILMLLSRHEEAKETLEIAIKVLCGLWRIDTVHWFFFSKHHLTHVPPLDGREEPQRSKVRSWHSIGLSSDWFHFCAGGKFVGNVGYITIPDRRLRRSSL